MRILCGEIIPPRPVKLSQFSFVKGGGDLLLAQIGGNLPASLTQKALSSSDDSHCFTFETTD